MVLFTSSGNWELQQQLTPRGDLEQYSTDTDIAPGTEAHREISGLLADVGLDVVAWRFRCADKVSFRTRLADGTVAHLPQLEIALRLDADFETQDRDWARPARGEDSWDKCGAIREGLNRVLAAHGFGPGFITPYTVVWPISWEKRSYFRLGHSLKPDAVALMEDMLRRNTRASVPLTRTSAPGIYFGSYWGARPGIWGQFNFLFPTEPAMLRAEAMQDEFCESARAMLAAADRDGFCLRHEVGCGLYFSGMPDLPPLYRED